MWLPGHVAVAFVLCLPLLFLMKEQRGLALAYVAFFAVLPDFLHFGPLRMASHSILGSSVMLAAALVPLIVLFRPRPALLLTAAVATFAHLLADLYIGSIYPFWPWDPEYAVMHALDTVFAYRAEALFIVLAGGILLFLLRPWSALRNIRSYTPSQRRNLLALVLPFGLMSLAEGAYFFLFYFRYVPGTMNGVVLLAFLAVVLLSAAMALLALLPATAPAEDRRAQRQLF